jgi:hypothetical protein
LSEDEQKVYDFIKEINKVFGECEFIAKGKIGAAVKTKGYIHKLYTEIIPYVKLNQVKKEKRK